MIAVQVQLLSLRHANHELLHAVSIEIVGCGHAALYVYNCKHMNIPVCNDKHCSYIYTRLL